MDSFIFIPLTLWSILFFFLLFRAELPFSVKMIMFFILASTFAFWYDEMIYFFNNFESIPFKDYLQIGLDSVYSIFMSLLWIWPLTLLFVFYAASDLDSIRVIIILSFFTLFIWVVFFAGTYFFPLQT